MARKIRFAIKVVLQPAQFESITLSLEEEIEVPDDANVTSTRRRLIQTVESELEREVLKARKDIADARRAQESRRK